MWNLIFFSHLIINSWYKAQVLGFPNIFQEGTRVAQSYMLYSCCTSFKDERSSVLPQQTQEMNSIEVSRNPGRQITNRLSWRKESLVMSGSDISGWKLESGNCFSLSGCCVDLYVQGPTGKSVQTGCCCSCILEDKSWKKKFPHHSVSLADWKQFTWGAIRLDLWSLSVKVNIKKRLKFVLFPWGY